MDQDLHSPHTADPHAPVVVRFAAVGDVVLLTVLLQAMSDRWGRPVHVLGSGEWTPVLLGHDPCVSELRILSSRKMPYWLTPSQWTADRWLRAHRGPVVLCEQDKHARRIIEQAGIPAERLVRAWDHWPGDDIHWADWWLQIAMLDAPSCPGPSGPIRTLARPRLHVPQAWHDEAEIWRVHNGLVGHPLVLVQPGHKKTHKRGRIGTSYHDKHWPAEHWAEVIRGVWGEMPNAAVLVNGSPREAALVQEIIDLAGRAPSLGRIVNVAARQPTLQRLTALAARAHSMISVDTGPSHIAGAMDCPTVVLYGAGGWGRWLPRAATSTVIPLGPRPPTPGARVLDLDPQQVLAAWRRLPPRGERLA